MNIVSKPLQERSFYRLATVAALAPLVMFFLDLPAVVLGIDRMNEIDRVTSATLWISLGGGLIAGGSAFWLGLSKSDHQSLSEKQWIAVFAWGPLSAFFVGWTLNWVATIVPGETRVVGATVESFRTGGRGLCDLHITVVRQGNVDNDRFCLTGGLGRRVGPEDLSVGESISLTIHATPIGSTVELIEHGEPAAHVRATTRGLMVGRLIRTPVPGEPRHHQRIG